MKSILHLSLDSCNNVDMCPDFCKNKKCIFRSKMKYQSSFLYNINKVHMCISFKVNEL